jgi:amino acid adenylation domain-containing protein
MISLEQSIADRFRSQVVQHPDRLALEDGARALTYAQLSSHVDAMACALLRRGVAREQRVVLLVDQGMAAVIATLGVLSAAAAYVPLDPGLLPAQLRDLVEDAEPALIIANRHYQKLAIAVLGDARRVLCVEDIESCETDRSLLDVQVSPDSLAYIYYTSGSTGKPKGVCDSHRNVLHNVWRYTTNLRIGKDDRLTLLQAPHFSGAVSSMFCALLNGAACFPYDVRREGLEQIGAWMRSRRITMFHSVPTIFREVIEDGGFAELRCVRLEGDRASNHDIELFRRHCPPGSMLANGLGATECGLVRQWRIDAQTAVPDGPVPIGEAVEDMQVRLLDDQGHDVAAGEIGEIAVRSRYLALGYWRRPELTATRFLSDSIDPSFRTYLSGDLGRMLPGAVLQYVGRKDHQSKIRGQWIDTTALERALLTFGGVREAVVSIRQDADREPRLVAYLVPQAEALLPIEPIRSHLRAHFPASMLPSSWVVLPALPLSANLKVDRSALPPPASIGTARSAEFVAPRNALERRIERIWSEVLGLDEVGVHDSLYALGADSLAIGRMRNRLVSAFAVDFPIATFFDRPTIAELAEELEALSGS